MTSIYYKTFRVPIWVILQKTQKENTVVNWFKERGAFVRDWPAETFKDTILGFRNRGWKHHLPKEMPYVLNPQLLAVAATEHVRETMGVGAQISFHVPPHHVDRSINTEKDYERVFNALLLNQDPVTLSQMFRVAELCHHGGQGKNHVVFLTKEPCNKNVLTVISDRVITVGDGDDADINLSKVNAREAKKYLESQFTALLSHQK